MKNIIHVLWNFPLRHKFGIDNVLYSLEDFPRSISFNNNNFKIEFLSNIPHWLYCWKKFHQLNFNQFVDLQWIAFTNSFDKSKIRWTNSRLIDFYSTNLIQIDIWSIHHLHMQHIQCPPKDKTFLLILWIIKCHKEKADTGNSSLL